MQQQQQHHHRSERTSFFLSYLLDLIALSVYCITFYVCASSFKRWLFGSTSKTVIVATNIKYSFSTWKHYMKLKTCSNRSLRVRVGVFFFPCLGRCHLFFFWWWPLKREKVKQQFIDGWRGRQRLSVILCASVISSVFRRWYGHIGIFVRLSAFNISSSSKALA